MGAPQHSHEELIHEHEHYHVTHYRRPGREVSHLTAEHAHVHDHAAVTHAHQPHEDFQKEHPREAHNHDHGHPVERDALVDEASEESFPASDPPAIY